ncbi:MAG: arylsulfatase [Verrucomicrobiae bacterium]|nr:arylsulfatase [Verrucomicrobiae bacterium]
MFILADDLGYRELGCFGQEKIRTPNLDRLAKQGMRLTQHYAGNAVCAPSRCVLMTGKHPGHAYIRNNRGIKPEGQEPIPASEVTIAELLKAQGYVTGAFGKWGLGGPESSGQPLDQGLDRFFGYNCQSHAHSYYPSYLWSDRLRIPLKNEPAVPGHVGLAPGADPLDPRSYEPFKGQDYAPDRIHEQAMQFIRDNKDRPFFLYYPSVIPHVALHVPDEELRPYHELKWNDPPFTRANNRGYTPHFTPRAAYAAMITRLDRYCGNVLKLLDELNLSDNTIVIFSSDNGTTHLDEEVDFKFFNSVGELRGGKGSLYEGGIRVPLIVRWPDVTPREAVCREPVVLMDLFHTLGRLTQTSPSPTLPRDGLDLLSLLRKPSGTLDRDALFFHYPHYYPTTTPVGAVRARDWKLLEYFEDNRIELYNLATDPGEQTDLAGQEPDKVEELRQRLHDWRTSVQAAMPKPNPGFHKSPASP